MICEKCKNISIDGKCCEGNIDPTNSSLDFNTMSESINYVKYTSESTTNQLVCTKCGSKQLQVKSIQNRSADESVTVYVHCLSCGHTESGESVAN